MAWSASPKRAYHRWPGKRRHSRGGVGGWASADFITPSQVLISDISRGGVGLNGVQQVAMRSSGLVQLELPGTVASTTAVAKICWSDGHGRIGLKFLELRGTAGDWDSWFAFRPSGEVAPEAELASSSPSDSAAALAEASPAAGGEAVAARTAASPLPGRGAIAEAASADSSAPGFATGHQDEEIREELLPGGGGGSFRRALQSALRLWWLWFLVIAAITGIVVYRRWPGKAAVLQQLTAAMTERPAKRAPARPAVRPQEPNPSGAGVRIGEGKPALQSSLDRAAGTIRRGKAVSQVPPHYPMSALDAGVEGDVHIVLMVSAKGIVEEVKVVRGNPVLAREVVSAAAHWRYTPFQVESSPVAVKLPATVRFRISEALAAER